MLYGKIEGLNKPVSRIILGGSSDCLRKGGNCDELLDAAFAAGVNTFDTARGYGKSERVLGDWLARKGLRDKAVVQTKGALHGLLGNNRVKAKCIRSDLQKSLAELDLPYADIYLLHRDDPATEVGWIVELMNELHAEGKIKVFGVSNWRYVRIQAANEYAYKHGLKPFVLSQPYFGLAEAEKWIWIGCVSVTGAKNAEERAWYARTQFPLTAFSPLGGGFFSGKIQSDDIAHTKRNINFAMRTAFLTPNNIERLKRTERIAAETGYAVPQIALAWALQCGMNVFTVVGNGRAQTLEKNLAALEVRLTREQIAYMNLERENC